MDETLTKSIHALNQSPTKSKAGIVTFCAAGFFFYQFMLINIFNAFNEPMLKEFHLTATQLGHVSATYYLAGTLSLLLAGIVLDRFAVRKVIITAFSVSIISTLLFAISPTPLYATLARFVAGISGTYCFLSPMKIASRWYPAKQLALIIGLIVSYAMVGGIIAQTPMILLADAIGWRHAAMLAALLGLFLLLLIIWQVNDSPEDAPSSEHLLTHQSLKDFLHNLKFTIMNLQNWISGLYISLINLPMHILGAIWGITYLVQVHHLSRTQASYVTSMIFIGMIIGSPTMGWLSDKMGQRKKPMILFGLLTLIPFVALIGSPQLSLGSLMLVFLTIGFTIGVQIIGYPLVAESNSKSQYATAQGLTATLVIMGGLTQPLFAHLMSMNWDHRVLEGVPIYTKINFDHALMMMPLAILMALVIISFARETYCRYSNQE